MGGSVPKRLHCKTHTVIASRAATWQSTSQTMRVLQNTRCYKHRLPQPNSLAETAKTTVRTGYTRESSAGQKKL